MLNSDRIIQCEGGDLRRGHAFPETSSTMRPLAIARGEDVVEVTGQFRARSGRVKTDSHLKARLTHEAAMDAIGSATE